MDLLALRAATGVQLDAVWQVSPYGGDMQVGTPQTHIPDLG